MSMELKADSLRKTVDPDTLRFDDTSQLERLTGIIGQERAVQALQVGLQMAGEGFNIYVAGPSGIGKMTSVRSFLEDVATTRKTPPDWCYVHNFDDPYEPKAIRLEAGNGNAFKSDLDDLIESLQTDLVESFESESYSSERDEKLNNVNQKRKEIFDEIGKEAREEGFSMQITPMGVALLPLNEEGEPINDQKFQSLPEEKQREIREKQQEFMDKINDATKKMRRLQREGQENLKDLDQKVVMNVVGGIIDDLIEKYNENAGAVEHLKAIKEDVIENIDELKMPLMGNEQQAGNPQLQNQMKVARKQALRKYRANVIVNNENREGAPLVTEMNPTYMNLIGRIEKEMQMGALSTDFTLLQAGSLLRASGGFLVVQAEDILRKPFSWDALKRSLRSGEIRIEELGEQYGLVSIKTLRPQAIPLDTKIIIVGPPLLYYLLHAYDGDFPELFKIKADYDVRMDRDDGNAADFTRFICTFCGKEGIRHLDASGVARILEYGARLAGHQEKLSTNFGSIGDVIREAGYWCSKDGGQYVSADHIQRALDQKVYRSNLIQEKIQESIDQGLILIDVTGEAVGQVNGLSVIMLGDYEFGRPNRITATVGAGREGIVDLEREVEMGGPVHSKGVLILSGYISSRYSFGRPFTLTARLVFEQSYEGIEGDSASSAELYTILSALAEAPIRQQIAVTGSVNQRGKVQAVGGINRKIEGFYDVCSMKELTGEQGVIIPRSNMQNLMLRKDVIDAVTDNRFHIWAVDTVDEGIEILTGVPAGEPDEKGEYPENSISNKVISKLRQYENSIKELQSRGD